MMPHPTKVLNTYDHQSACAAQRGSIGETLCSKRRLKSAKEKEESFFLNSKECMRMYVYVMRVGEYVYVFILCLVPTKYLLEFLLKKQNNLKLRVISISAYYILSN